MQRVRSALLLVILIGLSPVTTVQGQVDFSQLYTFGDSLTDNDAEFLSMFFGVNPKLYGTDPIEAVFDKAADDDDQLTNFAVLGSRSSDVLAQTMAYADLRATDSIPAATFYSVQGGANDFLDLENNSLNLILLASTPPGRSKDVDSVVNGVILNLQNSISTLMDSTPAPIVLWTVPDVTITPYVMSLQLSLEQQTNVRSHIERVNNYIRAFNQEPNFAIFDSFDLLNELAENPPLILDTVILPAPHFGFATAQFADPIHPTAITNAIAANEIIAELNREYGDDISPYTEDEIAAMAGLN